MFRDRITYQGFGATLFNKILFNESGIISVRKSRKSAIYQIRDLNSLMNEVIPHFNRYPLISQKQKIIRYFLWY